MTGRWIALLLVLGAGVLGAEEGFLVKKEVAYDDGHVVQRLDAYLVASDSPVPVVVFFHGGGWRGGSKSQVPGFLMGAVKEGRFSVVAVEYRFTDVAVHPAQVNDCARAVQFVRSKAKAWNLDPGRIGVCGGSAGGHLSLWVALHDDFAKVDSEDPVERESSRVACAISFAGPADWGLLKGIEHGHPAYRQLIGYTPGTAFEEMDAARVVDVSPISFASKDDPPVLLVHGDADVIVPVQHARELHARLDAVGGESELFEVAGRRHDVAGAGGEAVVGRSLAFLKQHLGGE